MKARAWVKNGGVYHGEKRRDQVCLHVLYLPDREEKRKEREGDRREGQGKREGGRVGREASILKRANL